jgi:hypothetical protein
LLGGEAAFEACNPDPAMVQIDVLAAQVAELRHVEPMIERQPEHGGIAPVVVRVSGTLEEDEKFRLGEIVA